MIMVNRVAMSAQRSLTERPAAGVAIVGADLDDRKVVTVARQTEAALTTAPALPADVA